jgi:hypothetical protein
MIHLSPFPSLGFLPRIIRICPHHLKISYQFSIAKVNNHTLQRDNLAAGKNTIQEIHPITKIRKSKLGYQGFTRDNFQIYFLQKKLISFLWIDSIKALYCTKNPEKNKQSLSIKEFPPFPQNSR